MTESCLAGVPKGLLARGTESLPKVTCASATKVCARAAPCCASATSLLPMSAKTFCALPKALWARSADLTSVPGGLVCNTTPSHGRPQPHRTVSHAERFLFSWCTFALSSMKSYCNFKIAGLGNQSWNKRSAQSFFFAGSFLSLARVMHGRLRLGSWY